MREEVWLTSFQVNEVDDLLRAISQTQQDKLLESLRSNVYQCWVRLMTVNSPKSKKLGSVNVYGMFEHRGKDQFLTLNFFYSTADSRHRLSCFSARNNFGRASTGYLLWPIQKNFLSASGSEVLTDHDLLSSIGSVLFGTVL